MKWLITGCSGLLGANACHILRNGNQIVGVSRGSFNMQGIEHYSLSFSGKEMGDILRVEKPDVILHCAAMTNVDLCEGDKEIALDVNAYAPFELAKRAQEYGAKFVFISSDAVFDGKKVEPYSEGDPTCPINVYGASKALAEELIINIDSALILRTNMYGFNYQSKKSLSEWVVSSLSDGVAIRMFDDVLFSPLLANSLVEAIVHLVHEEASGIVHVGSSNNMSKFDFGSEISSHLGVYGLIDACSVDDFDFRARRSHNMALDTSFAKSLGLSLPTIEDDLSLMMQLRAEGYDKRIKERAT